MRNTIQKIFAHLDSCVYSKVHMLAAFQGQNNNSKETLKRYYLGFACRRQWLLSQKKFVLPKML